MNFSEYHLKKESENFFSEAMKSSHFFEELSFFISAVHVIGCIPYDVISDRVDGKTHCRFIGGGREEGRGQLLSSVEILVIVFDNFINY